jgi:hypothetical protein
MILLQALLASAPNLSSCLCDSRAVLKVALDPFVTLGSVPWLLPYLFLSACCRTLWMPIGLSKGQK